MAKLSKQEEKDLSKALNYANWSLLGVVVPLIGWLLGGMALSFAKSVPENEKSIMRLEHIRRMAWVGIIIATLAAAGWAGYFRYQVVQAQKHQEQIQKEAKQAEKEQQEAKQQQEAQERRAKLGLSNCLFQAQKSYSEGFTKESEDLGRTDGLLPQANADRWDGILKDSKEECYQMYNSGLFDNYIPSFGNP